MSINEILSSKSLSTLRSSKADKRSSLIVLCNLLFTNAIRLNERSPEQLVTIKDMNMRNAMESNGDIGECAVEVLTVDQTGKIRW